MAIYIGGVLFQTCLDVVKGFFFTNVSFVMCYDNKLSKSSLLTVTWFLISMCTPTLTQIKKEYDKKTPYANYLFLIPVKLSGFYVSFCWLSICNMLFQTYLQSSELLIVLLTLNDFNKCKKRILICSLLWSMTMSSIPSLIPKNATFMMSLNQDDDYK